MPPRPMRPREPKPPKLPVTRLCDLQSAYETPRERYHAESSTNSFDKSRLRPVDRIARPANSRIETTSPSSFVLGKVVRSDIQVYIKVSPRALPKVVFLESQVAMMYQLDLAASEIRKGSRTALVPMLDCKIDWPPFRAVGSVASLPYDSCI